MVCCFGDVQASKQADAQWMDRVGSEGESHLPSLGMDDDQICCVSRAPPRAGEGAALQVVCLPECQPGLEVLLPSVIP